MKKLVLFIHRDAGESGAIFLRTIQERFTTIKIEVYQTNQELKTYLRTMVTDIFAKRFIVLFADTQDRLNRLYELVDLFQGEQLVALLPEKAKDTMDLVHKFLPRYFSFVDAPYDDVCSVLTKMINR